MAESDSEIELIDVRVKKKAVDVDYYVENSGNIICLLYYEYLLYYYERLQVKVTQIQYDFHLY